MRYDPPSPENTTGRFTLTISLRFVIRGAKAYPLRSGWHYMSGLELSLALCGMQLRAFFDGARGSEPWPFQ
jgi:hypothetical protein